MPLQKVVVIQDNDSHWYVIPAHLREEFRQLEQKCDKSDDYDEFEDAFGSYRTGGDITLIQLYADI